MPEDPNPTATAADPLDAIVAALTEGGPRTAGQLADYMGIPYSSLTRGCGGWKTPAGPNAPPTPTPGR